MSQIVIVATVDVKPEHKQAFIDFCQGLVENSRKESGNIQYDLHQHLSNDNTFSFVEIWASQAAIDEHNASPHFGAFKTFVEGKVNSLNVELMHKII